MEVSKIVVDTVVEEGVEVSKIEVVLLVLVEVVGEAEYKVDGEIHNKTEMLVDPGIKEEEVIKGEVVEVTKVVDIKGVVEVTMEVVVEATKEEVVVVTMEVVEVVTTEVVVDTKEEEVVTKVEEVTKEVVVIKVEADEAGGEGISLHDTKYKQ